MVNCDFTVCLMLRSFVFVCIRIVCIHVCVSMCVCAVLKILLLLDSIVYIYPTRNNPLLPYPYDSGTRVICSPWQVTCHYESKWYKGMSTKPSVTSSQSAALLVWEGTWVKSVCACMLCAVHSASDCSLCWHYLSMSLHFNRSPRKLARSSYRFA